MKEGFFDFFFDFVASQLIYYYMSWMAAGTRWPVILERVHLDAGWPFCDMTQWQASLISLTIKSHKQHQCETFQVMLDCTYGQFCSRSDLENKQPERPLLQCWPPFALIKPSPFHPPLWKRGLSFQVVWLAAKWSARAGCWNSSEIF